MVLVIKVVPLYYGCGKPEVTEKVEEIREHACDCYNGKLLGHEYAGKNCCKQKVYAYSGIFCRC